MKDPFAQQINKYCPHFGKELRNMLKSKMSRVIAHKEIGLRTELMIILRKKEMHVLLELLLTLVHSLTHQAGWLLQFWGLSPVGEAPNSLLKTQALEMRVLEVLVLYPGTQHCHFQCSPGWPESHTENSVQATILAPNPKLSSCPAHCV